MATAKKAMDAGKAYDRFLPETRLIAHVQPLRADVALALKNVSRGVEAVLRYEIRIRRELPRIDVKELRSLPDLARAVVYAAAEVDRAAPPKDDLRQLLARARTVRRLLLTSADKLAAAGIADPAAVAKIRQGFGPADSARDCVALAALFRKCGAAAKGKTPVKVADIDESEALGTALLERLKAAKAPRPATPLAAATLARDRLWTLLVQRHDVLWRVGAYVFGRDVDKRVPGLKARSSAKVRRDTTA